MYCSSCGHSTAGEGRCRRCGSPASLPGEGELRVSWQAGTLPPADPSESAWRAHTHPFSISADLPLDRRRVPRDPPPADGEDARSTSTSTAAGLAHPLVHVGRRSDLSVRWLEVAARTDDLLRRMGETLLSNPLDPRPVPALERRAAATGNERLLAELYEALLDAKPDHPSRATLMRRIDRLGGSPGAADAVGEEANAPPAGPPVLEAKPVPTARFAIQATGPAMDTDLPWEEDPEPEGPAANLRDGDPDALIEGASLALDDGAAQAHSTPTRPAGEVEWAQRAAAPEGTFDGQDAEEIDAELGNMIVRAGGSPSPLRTAVALRRLGAWAIDGVLLAGASGTILLAGTGSARDVVSLATGHPLGAGQGASVAGLALAGAIAFVYLTLCWSLGGRTLGGSLVGVRTVDRESGAPLAIGRAALRALFAIAGTLAFLAGPLWALVDRDGEALHDKLVRSAIVAG